MTIGSRLNFNLKLATDSASGIILNPDWGYKEQQNIRRSFNLSQNGGGLSAYTISDSGSFLFDFPLTFFGSSDSAIVNSWWTTQADLILTYQTSKPGLIIGQFTLDDPVFGMLDQVYNPLDEVVDGVAVEAKNVRIINSNTPFSVKVKGQYNKFQGIIFLTTI